MMCLLPWLLVLLIVLKPHLCTLLQVEWRDDLRRVLKQAGAQFQPTAFLFSDTQLKDESFLEDINNILNTGEVPNLFPKVRSFTFKTHWSWKN